MVFRLLIADDEELVRRGLTALVTREAPGITLVGPAVDGLEALEMAQRLEPDIVLTDIRMPGMSGLDLIDRLRISQPQARCIILSGYDEFAYARQAIGLGVVDYLLKPVDPDDLLGLLARVSDQIAAARRAAKARERASRIATEDSVRRLLIGLPLDEASVAACLTPSPLWGLLLVRPLAPKLIDELAREQGMSILMISSELEEVIEGSDRVIVMKDGRKLGELAHGEASEDLVMKAISEG